MSYLTQTHIAANPTLILRIAACAASEGIADPRFWAQENMVHLAVTDGWCDEYARSTADDPGADESAITDEMIADAVRAMVSASAERAHAAAMTTKEETIE